MRLLFTICGRAGSKGIKNKNLRDFVGKPLMYYSISAIDLFLKRTELAVEADIVINSDSKELLAMGVSNSMRPVDTIDRVAELAGDSIGKVSVIQDCLIRMENKKGYNYDAVIDLDITSPLRKVQDLEALVKKHFETNADVTTSVATARRNPYFNQLKRTEHGYKKVIASEFTARQQAPEIFDMNASLYAYKPDFLRTGKGVLDGYVECIEMYDTGILDLDHENDFELMEVIAKHLFANLEDFKVIYTNISV